MFDVRLRVGQPFVVLFRVLAESALRNIHIRYSKEQGNLELGADRSLKSSSIKYPAPLSIFLGLLDEFRFQLHCTDAIDPAVDIMVAIYETDDPDLGSDLDHR